VVAVAVPRAGHVTLEAATVRFSGKAARRLPARGPLALVPWKRIARSALVVGGAKRVKTGNPTVYEVLLLVVNARGHTPTSMSRALAARNNPNDKCGSPCVKCGKPVSCSGCEGEDLQQGAYMAWLLTGIQPFNEAEWACSGDRATTDKFCPDCRVKEEMAVLPSADSASAATRREYEQTVDEMFSPKKPDDLLSDPAFLDYIKGFNDDHKFGWTWKADLGAALKTAWGIPEDPVSRLRDDLHEIEEELGIDIDGDGTRGQPLTLYQVDFSDSFTIPDPQPHVIDQTFSLSHCGRSPLDGPWTVVSNTTGGVPNYTQKIDFNTANPATLFFVYTTVNGAETGRATNKAQLDAGAKTMTFGTVLAGNYSDLKYGLPTTAELETRTVTTCPPD
jgi:hypothetical protein